MMANILSRSVFRISILTVAVVLSQMTVTACWQSAAVVCASDCGADSDMDEEWECYLDGGVDGGEDGGTETSDRHLVCVFDIDDTLTCEHSAEAVRACKDLGAYLAINTAESHDTALNNKAGTGYVDWAALGFPTDGVALDMDFGAFMFGRCNLKCSCSEKYGGAPGDCDMCDDCGPGCPEDYMGKAYGMHRIAKYYNVEPNKCLVLFDDTMTNIDVARTFCYSAYCQGDCEDAWDYDGVYEAVYGFLTSGEFDDCRQ